MQESAMFSKRILALLACLCVGTGCNLPLYEKPPAQVAPDTGLGTTTACLSNLPKVIEKFAAGTAHDAEVGAMFDCMSTAVATFEQSTQGRFEDRFTSKELTNFIRQYFLAEGTVVSDSVRVEVFRIKQLFVGGANDSITRVEMQNLLSVIASLKQITLQLNPYAKLYFFHWKLSEAESLQDQMNYFQAANMTVQKASRDLGSLIEKNGMTYHLDNAVVLVKELAKLNSANWPWVDKFEKAMPLVRKLKRTLAGGSEAEVEPKEWTQFALLSGRGYMQYLRYFYFLESAPNDFTEAQLFYITRSVDDLFLFMGDMVEGKPNQILTRHELLEILQALSQFVPKLKISDSLLVELMKVKILLFGGGLDQFKKSDFEYARTKLEIYQRLTGKLLTYSNVYAMTWDPKASSPAEAKLYFENAEKNLISVTTDLGDSLETSYNLNDLIKLAKEIDQLYPNRNRSFEKTAQKYIPVVVAFKNILLSDQDSVVGDKVVSSEPEELRTLLRKQWGLFLSSTANLYSRYAYSNYFLQPLPAGQTSTSPFFKQLVNDSVAFLENLIAQKPANPIRLIHFDELNRLWGALSKAELLPEKIKLSTMDLLTRVAAQRILNPPEDRLAGKNPEGLTQRGMQVLRSEFGQWSANQEFLARVYMGVSENQGLAGSQILARLNSEPASDPINELKMIYQTPLALSFDAQGRMVFSKPPAPYFKSTADQINLVRTAVRLLIRSYAGEMNRIISYEGLNSAEFNVFFNDLKPILSDLELLDPNGKGFADNRFRDANLFSPFANGNDLIDFREISSLSLLLISGLKVNSMVQETLSDSCKVNHPSEDQNTWTVDYNCLLMFYSRQINQKFVSMPDFVKYKTTLTTAQFADMFLNLLKASGYVDTESKQVRLADLALFPHVTQYVETVYQIYDVNRDGILDTPESMKAYPIYKSTLQQVSKLTGDMMLKGLFAWLLKHGKAPTPSEQFKFLAWAAAGEKTWDIKADRAKLAQILGVIADAMANPNQNLFFHIMDSTGSEVF
jgi:hypothetical protein